MIKKVSQKEHTMQISNDKSLLASDGAKSFKGDLNVK